MPKAFGIHSLVAPKRKAAPVQQPTPAQSIHTPFDTDRMTPTSCETTVSPVEEYQSIQEPFWRPPYTPTLSNLERFDNETQSLFTYLKTTDHETKMRQIVFQSYKRRIETFDPRFTVHLFGSSATGIHLPDGDLDIVLCFKNPHQEFLHNRHLIVNFLRRLDQLLKSGAHSMQVIRAKIPLLKLVDKISNLHLDISLNTWESSAGAVNVVKCLLKQVPGVLELFLIMKQYLRSRGLDSNSTGGVGGYGLVLWIASFVRVQGAIYDEKSGGESKRTRMSSSGLILPLDLEDDSLVVDMAPNVNIGKLLLRFLHFFGFCFDFKRAALAPAGRNGVSTDILILKGHFATAGEFALSIVDPCNVYNNVTVASSRIDEIVAHIRNAYTTFYEDLNSSLSPNHSFWAKVMRVPEYHRVSASQSNSPKPYNLNEDSEMIYENQGSFSTSEGHNESATDETLNNQPVLDLSCNEYNNVK